MDITQTTVHEYLENLPETIHNKLYQSSTTCLAIFRLLPSLSKFYIVSLIFQENSTISYPELNKWLKNSSQTSIMKALQSNSLKIYQNESLKKLRLLNLIKEFKKQVKNPKTGNLTNVTFFSLNDVFKQNLRNSLIGGSNATDDGMLMSANKTMDLEFLDKWCLEKWETILHFMVGTDLKALPSDGVLSLLNHSGLMELPTSSAGLKNLKITKDGFQFLLQEINSQIWILLLQYLKISEQLMMNSVDVLNFIFLLGSLELGKGYSIDSLSSTQKIMLEDLIDYGLIYQDKDKSVFYPTKLSTNLTSDPGSYRSASTAMDSYINDDTANGSLIIEINFKLYCYTESPLQIAILNLFVHLRTRFSNMVCGNITRESTRNALKSGITSEQIINYLEAHCHPQMKKLAEERLAKKIDLDHSNQQQENLLELIPPTVIDQIKLWQLELERIQTYSGFLFKDFTTDVEFEKLSKYAEEIGVLLWKNVQARKFFVTQAGNKQIVEFANRNMRRNNGSNTTPAPS